MLCGNHLNPSISDFRPAVLSHYGVLNQLGSRVIDSFWILSMKRFFSPFVFELLQGLMFSTHLFTEHN